MDLGEKAPFDAEDATGGMCDRCATALMEDIHRETGLAYFVVLSRRCAELFPTVNAALGSSPHVKVIVDRRHSFPDHPIARPPSSGPGVSALQAPPRYHMVIRRDFADLYEELAPAFAGRRDIHVMVDRRSRSRTPSRPLPADVESRQADPPVWVV